MTDRELLKLAAKAAGIEVVWGRFGFGQEWLTRTNTGDLCPWRPLHDDGDALQLSVRLRLSIDHNHHADDVLFVRVNDAACTMLAAEEFEDEGQRAPATRRAIVCAAAEIGKGALALFIIN